MRPSLEALSTAYRNLGDDERAQEVLEAGVETLQAVPDTEQVELGSYYLQLGEIHLASGELESAQSYFAMSVEKSTQFRGEDHPDVVMAMERLGGVERAGGEPLLKEKMAALDRLAELDLDTVLVAAVERGVNEHEVGRLVQFGIDHPAVRGVNFQPVTHTGRHLPFDPNDRVTIPEVIQRIQDQTDGLFVKSDFVPVPCCHPGCQSITYAYVEDGQVTPLPRVLNVDEYLDYITNRTWPDTTLENVAARMWPDGTPEVKEALESLWSATAVPGTESVAEHFSCASCNIDLSVGGHDLAKHIFVVSVKDFMDAYTFDIKKLMKCCVEIISPDGRLIPFCAYNNVGYREEIRETLKKERARTRLQRSKG